MAVQGAQEFWVAGARVFLQRTAIAGVEQPLLDLGVITEVDPNWESDEATLKDPDGGISQIVDRVVTSREESYNVTIANFNPDNLNLLYNGDAVQPFTQGAAPVTNVDHYAHPGRLVKVHDANGVWIYGLTSIDAVSIDGGADYVEGTDWEVVDLERGVFRMIDGGAFAAAAIVDVDYTPKSLSGNRLILPQTGDGVIQAKVGLFIGRAEKAEQHVREMLCTIQTDSISVPTEEHASWVAKLTVIKNYESTSQPFGRLLHFVGDVPALS